MRSSRSMGGDIGHSRALVKDVRQTSIALRNKNLAVAAPKPLPVPLTLKARRSATKLISYSFLGACFVVAGYGAGDRDIRNAIDYRMSLFVAAGVSSYAPTAIDRIAVPQPLPDSVLPLFAEGHKGPRADRFADVLNSDFQDSIARHTKGAPLNLSTPEPEPKPQGQQTAAMAGASLFLSTFAPPVEESAAAAAPAPEPPPEALAKSGNWAGLLHNASLSPEEPKTTFGGLTEDEFRTRELRCMATAIYFEARDEPIKGQIAVGQVVMNRIRSPFYPKTICGVVYQGERNRHGCQFSFTCTGKRNVIKEKEEWATSVKLAKQVITGEVWIDEVGYATHYHATYVHPPWRRELDRLTQIGHHIFYKIKPGTVQVALLSEGL
jgi:spore germination cell wall hydrolase CwlJ-like protein